MKLRLLAVGKLREASWRSLCDDYQSRIRRYVPFEEVEVRDGAALSRAFQQDVWVVALEVNGSSPTSVQLAEQLGQWLQQPYRSLAFLIGGADGIPAELSRRANFRLSLSSLTLPHRLARVLLSEQLYRAFSILRGEPYAREE